LYQTNVYLPEPYKFHLTTFYLIKLLFFSFPVPNVIRLKLVTVYRASFIALVEEGGLSAGATGGWYRVPKSTARA
jgi:hypothetical protein